MKFTPRQPKSNVNVTPVSPLRELMVLTLGVVGVIVGAYWLLGLAVDLVVPRISVDFEKKLAAAIMPEWTTDAESEDPKQQALQAIATRLQRDCANLPYDFRIALDPSDAINAMALPGGRIVVFQGLVDRMGSENALAFVLAHEMGHYANRDHLRGLGRGLVLMALSTALFGADSAVSDLVGSGVGITEMAFSRSQESRADMFALGVTHCAYGHVGGATGFFEEMSREEDPSVFQHYFSTHPENTRRINAIRQRADEEAMPWEDTIPLPSILTDADDVESTASDPES